MPELSVVGGPEWVDSERYDIDARAEGTIDARQSALMVRRLLEDRFKLRAVMETRELPIYDLVVARSGLKLKLPEDQTPVPPPGQGPEPGPGTPRGFHAALIGGKLTGSAMPVSNLVDFLTRYLGRPVYDKTGLTGMFDMTLEWTPGTEQAPTPFGPNPNFLPPSETSGATLFTTLQEQMGLRLESKKGPVEVVVIHSAEKPSEN